MDYARLPCDAALARSGPASAGRRPARVGVWVLALTILGSGMTFIDGTVVNVVLPVLDEQLAASPSQLQWIVEGYMLPLTALMLLGGSLGDRYGRRRIFVIGTVVFAVASAGCGLAPNVTVLIVARCLQGAGAALLVPGSLALISATFSVDERGKAIGSWAAGTSIAAGAGPLLGAWLVDLLTWRAVFLINLPIAAVIVWIAVARVPNDTDGRARAGLDWRGAGLVTAGLGALVFGLIGAGQSGASPAVVANMLIGVTLLSAFVFTERALEKSGRSVMIPLSMFAVPTFAGVNLLTIFLYAALTMVTFVLPFTLIDVHGYSVVAAASAMLPFVALMFALSPSAGRLMDRLGPRPLLIIGPLMTASGYLLMTRIMADGTYLATVFPAVVAMSLGMALSVAPLTATVMKSAGDQRAGVASGINNAVSRLASLLAVGLVGMFTTGNFGAALASTSIVAAGLAIAGAGSAAVLIRDE